MPVAKDHRSLIKNIPPINNIKNNIVKKLKYLSINILILSPKKYSKLDTK